MKHPFLKSSTFSLLFLAMDQSAFASDTSFTAGVNEACHEELRFHQAIFGIDNSLLVGFSIVSFLVFCLIYYACLVSNARGIKRPLIEKGSYFGAALSLCLILTFLTNIFLSNSRF
ncbi:hypothetical protein FAI40_08075 [Acetobacteraceae bacterium]|nr:hypothetical protein FAI40_08075 [Acetobacteraceae bacterium]